MFYRNLAPVIPMILMSNQFHRRPEHQNHSNYGSGQFNSSHEEDGFFENDELFGGGVVGPLLVGGLTGVALASLFGNKQAYAATPYPTQSAYPMQSTYPMQSGYAYPVSTYQLPIQASAPYYQQVPMVTQSMPTQAQIVKPNTVSQVQGGEPKMPAIQNMPNDITIQKLGQAYVTNPPMPSNQVTNSMPYYMFSIRKELPDEMRGIMPLQGNMMYRVIASQQIWTVIPSYTSVSYLG